MKNEELSKLSMDKINKITMITTFIVSGVVAVLCLAACTWMVNKVNMDEPNNQIAFKK